MKKSLSLPLFLLVFGCMFFLQGCIVLSVLPIVVSGIGSAAGYSILNTAYKTEIYPSKDVLRNAIRTLNKMGFVIIATKRSSKSGWDISAETKERKISIDLERITPKTTKVTVNVMEGSVMKDKATAEAIIAEIEEFLKKEAQSGKKAQTSFLFVTSKPDGATVKIMNIAPKFKQGIELPSGSYRLEVSMEEYETRKLNIKLKSYEERFLEIPLKRSPKKNALEKKKGKG